MHFYEGLHDLRMILFQLLLTVFDRMWGRIGPFWDHFGTKIGSFWGALFECSFCPTSCPNDSLPYTLCICVSQTRSLYALFHTIVPTKPSQRSRFLLRDEGVAKATTHKIVSYTIHTHCNPLGLLLPKCTLQCSYIDSPRLTDIADTYRCQHCASSISDTYTHNEPTYEQEE